MYVMKIGHKDVELSFLQIWYSIVQDALRYRTCESQKMREMPLVSSDVEL